MNRESQYLLVLYLTEQRAAGPIASGRIADAVDRSPAATTEMLQRLETRGLLTHEPYEGASLTPDGRETAEQLHETYTTLSTFFDEVLELDDAEGEALRLAGTVSPLVADRLAATLLDTDADSVSDQTQPMPSLDGQ